MILLELQLRDTTTFLNLDRVEAIEFERDSVDFWVYGRLSRNILKNGSAAEAQARFAAALQPVYDGRMNNVLGLKITLNLKDLQPDKVPF